MTLPPTTNLRPWRGALSAAFGVSCGCATLVCIVILCLLLGSVLYNGFGYLNWRFITGLPSRFPEKAGIWPALAGSVWLIILTAMFTVPIGIGTALYLEEYASPSRWRSLVQANIANLAGVPSIVYGILGLGLFVRMLRMGDSVLAGALTLSLVVLPIVILASQEALRAVPPSLRHASFALGATRWQTIWHQVLPAALPGMMTGVILALSRALGEAAPLVALGTATIIASAPRSPLDEFSALPLLIFDWAGWPQEAFRQNVAGAGILVLLMVLVIMNAAAVFIRQRFGRRIRW
jgi:phosphate transport system permease protein